MDDTKSKDLSGEFAGLTVAEAARAYREMADTVLATMYGLTADELFILAGRPKREAGRMTLLDVGTGMGHLASAMARRFAGHRLFALDLSPEIINHATTLGGFPAGVERLAADATRLPVRDGSVDLIASYGVVHHVPNKTALFSEIHRALAPGGIALIIDLSAETKDETVRFIEAHLSAAAAGALKESVREAVDPNEAERIIAGAGIADFSVTTTPFSRRAVALNAQQLRAAPLWVNPADIIWGAVIRKGGWGRRK